MIQCGSKKPSHALSAVPPAIATTSTFGEIFLRESVLSWALCCMLLSLDPQSRPLNSFKDSLVGKLCPCLSGHNHSFSPVCIQSDAAQFSAQEYWYQIHNFPHAHLKPCGPEGDLTLALHSAGLTLLEEDASLEM